MSEREEASSPATATSTGPTNNQMQQNASSPAATSKPVEPPRVQISVAVDDLIPSVPFTWKKTLSGIDRQQRMLRYEELNRDLRIPFFVEPTKLELTNHFPLMDALDILSELSQAKVNEIYVAGGTETAPGQYDFRTIQPLTKVLDHIRDQAGAGPPQGLVIVEKKALSQYRADLMKEMRDNAKVEHRKILDKIAKGFKDAIESLEKELKRLEVQNEYIRDHGTAGLQSRGNDKNLWQITDFKYPEARQIGRKPAAKGESQEYRSNLNLQGMIDEQKLRERYGGKDKASTATVQQPKGRRGPTKKAAKPEKVAKPEKQPPRKTGVTSRIVGRDENGDIYDYEIHDPESPLPHKKRVRFSPSAGTNDAQQRGQQPQVTPTGAQPRSQASDRRPNLQGQSQQRNQRPRIPTAPMVGQSSINKPLGNNDAYPPSAEMAPLRNGGAFGQEEAMTPGTQGSSGQQSNTIRENSQSIRGSVLPPRLPYSPAGVNGSGSRDGANAPYSGWTPRGPTFFDSENHMGNGPSAGIFTRRNQMASNQSQMGPSYMDTRSGAPVFGNHNQMSPSHNQMASDLMDNGGLWNTPRAPPFTYFPGNQSNGTMYAGGRAPTYPNPFGHVTGTQRSPSPESMNVNNLHGFGQAPRGEQRQMFSPPRPHHNPYSAGFDGFEEESGTNGSGRAAQMFSGYSSPYNNHDNGQLQRGPIDLTAEADATMEIPTKLNIEPLDFPMDDGLGAMPFLGQNNYPELEQFGKPIMDQDGNFVAWEKDPDPNSIFYPKYDN